MHFSVRSFKKALRIIASTNTELQAIIVLHGKISNAALLTSNYIENKFVWKALGRIFLLCSPRSHTPRITVFMLTGSYSP